MMLAVISSLQQEHPSPRSIARDGASDEGIFNAGERENGRGRDERWRDH
jgi:hypothetical protein